MSDLVTISTDNYAVMAKAMGIAGATVGTKTSNNLNRLRIWHSPIMGEEKIGNKLKKVEVVEGGVYRLELVDDDTSTYYYAKTARVRPFMQRYMLKRYESFSNVKDGDPKGTFHKTIMSDNLNTDLKDNKGHFNCGKPAGYIKDFKALPVEMQDLIKQTKRVRVVFGTIKLNNPTDDKGSEVELDEVPFIWEVDNRDAYKTIGDQFNIYAKKEKLPLNHYIMLKPSKENPMQNGSSFYTPIALVDLSSTIGIGEEDHKTFSSFLDWIKNYNDGVCAAWENIVQERQSEVSSEDMDTVDNFVDVELETNAKE